MLGPRQCEQVTRMHAFPAEASHSNHDLPPVLVVAQSEDGARAAGRSVASAGYRVADSVDIAAAPGRIALQARASAIWLELEEDADGIDATLDMVARDVADGRYGAIVAALVIDGSDSERAAALAIATSGIHRPDRLHDVASDQNNARLRQLSDEVSRIAATLARLSTGPGQPARPRESPPAKDIPEVSVDTVRAVIRARRLRSRFFAEDLFADPAWDMLLDLLQAELAQLRVPVSSLCIAAAVPATTALRWLKTMTAQGLFVRRADPHDGRRVFVELDPSASIAMRRYFAEVGNPATI
jgi:DNA-binding MarR family transcriptional regulator